MSLERSSAGGEGLAGEKKQGGLQEDMQAAESAREALLTRQIGRAHV